MVHSGGALRCSDVVELSDSLELTIEKSSLLKVLNHVQSVVERRGSIAILSNVKMEAFNGCVSLTATDMDVEVSEKVEAEVSEEGALTIPAHTFYDIVRKLPEGSQIELTGSASGQGSNDGKLFINSGSCKFSLSCLPVADFPVIDMQEAEASFELSPTELLALVDKTKFAISTGETRYYLNGIFFHTVDASEEGKSLVSVATDGHRLAKVEMPAPEGSEDMPGVIIPRKTVAELKKVIEGSEEPVSVSISNDKVRFVCANATLISKLIDGSFPDYKHVVPVENDKILEVDVQELIKSVDRVSTVALDKAKAVRFKVEHNKLFLEASNDESGTASEEIGVSYEGDPMDIGLNSRYLLDMLSSFEGEKVHFVFHEQGSPVIVRDTGFEYSLYVIMPMRI